MKKLIETIKTDIAAVENMQKDLRYMNEPFKSLLKEKKYTFETFLEKTNKAFERQKEQSIDIRSDLSTLYLMIQDCQVKNNANKEDVLIATTKCVEVISKLKDYDSDDNAPN